MLLATKALLRSANEEGAEELVAIARFLSNRYARKMIEHIWDMKVFCVKDTWSKTNIDYRTAQTIIRKMRTLRLIIDVDPPEGAEDKRFSYMTLNKNRLSPVVTAINAVIKQKKREEGDY